MSARHPGAPHTYVVKDSRIANDEAGKPTEVGDGGFQPVRLNIRPLRDGVQVDILPMPAARAAPPLQSAARELVAAFVAQRLERVPGAQVQARPMYHAFTTWCADRGARALGERGFASAMEAAGVVRLVQRVRQYVDVKLREENHE